MDGFRGQLAVEVCNALLSSEPRGLLGSCYTGECNHSESRVSSEVALLMGLWARSSAVTERYW